MAAYRRVYDSCHLQADCQGPASAPESYARYSSIGYLFTRVSRYQKGKTILILLKEEAVSGSSISWAICKSAPRSRQITTPAQITHRQQIVKISRPQSEQQDLFKGQRARTYSGDLRA